MPAVPRRVRPGARPRRAALETLLQRAGIGGRRLQRRRRQRLSWPWPPRACSARAPWPSPATAPAIRTATASSRCGWPRDFQLIHEFVPTAELLRDGYRQNAGDRCYHCKTELYEHAHRAGPRPRLRRRGRRHQRRRSRRLSARPAGGARVRRAQSARRARLHQGRHPRAGPRPRHPGVGRAGFGVPVVADPASQRGHGRASCRRSSGPKAACGPSVSASSACAITSGLARLEVGADELAAPSRSGDGRRASPRRSRPPATPRSSIDPQRLSPGQPERSALPAGRCRDRRPAGLAAWPWPPW